MSVTPVLPEGTVCSARVVASLVTDLDTADPADAMLSDAIWSFTTATPPAVLAIDKSVIPLAPSLLGSVVTYTVQLQNSGGPAAGVVLSDTLPTGIAFGVLLDPPVGATADAGAIRWQGDVGFGQPVVLRYTGVITTNETFAGELLSNTATFEHQGTMGSDTAQVRVASDMDVSTSTTTVDKTLVRPDDLLTFTITVRNTGSKAASVTVVDPLSPLIQLKDAGDFTRNPPDGPLTWTGTVAAQGERVLQFSARVRLLQQLLQQPLPWSFANTATLTVTGSTPVPVTSQTITVPLNRVLIPRISR
jgi:uncharacterized repeat protein (TIGR01451 family)